MINFFKKYGYVYRKVNLTFHFFRSYLFGDVAIIEAEVQDGGNEGELDDIQQLNLANQVNPINLDGDLGAAHQALIQREGPTGFQPYNRPNLFPLRVS